MNHSTYAIKLAGTISNNVVLLPKLPGIMMVPGGPQHPSLYDAGLLMSVSVHQCFTQNIECKLRCASALTWLDLCRPLLC